MESNSILTSIKKLLGIEEDYEHFDQDVIIHINSAISGLRQLGVGPRDGFRIKSKEETWDDYIGDKSDMEEIKSCIYLKVKLIFDPPINGTYIDAINSQISEYEFRLSCSANR